MRIEKDEAGGALKLSGPLRIQQAAELHTALCEYIPAAVEPALELSEVSECDTAALQLLWSARRTAELAGKPLAFRGVSDAIRETSAAIGLGEWKTEEGT